MCAKYNKKGSNSSTFFGNSGFSLKKIFGYDKKEEPKIEVIRETSNPTIKVEKTRTIDFKLEMDNFEDSSVKIEVPDSVRQTGIISDMTPFEKICNDTEKTWIGEQGKVAAIWKKEKKSSRSIAMIDGRYLVAVNDRFGEVGDNIDVYLEDGTIINCTIMDIKGEKEDNSSPYGHYFENASGNKRESLIEWEVLSSIKDPSDLSPFIDDWHLKNVVQIVNTGTNIIK